MEAQLLVLQENHIVNVEIESQANEDPPCTYTLEIYDQHPVRKSTFWFVVES